MTYPGNANSEDITCPDCNGSGVAPGIPDFEGMAGSPAMRILVTNRYCYLCNGSGAAPTDSALLNLYEVIRVRSEALNSQRHHLQGLLIQRMEARGATSIPSEEYKCELEPRVEYRQIDFTPLKEIFSERELATCFHPKYEELITYPEHWDTNKVKALAKKHGDKAMAIVEQARLVGTPRLKFGRR